jgi:branched-subunit amino acid aminotransferase/4-amino-4-deoxychorismate lyase
MHAMRYLIFDFRIQRQSEARLGVSSPALLHGDSLFETLPVLEAVPLFLDQHLARLEHSMHALGYKSQLDRASLRTAIDNLLTGNLVEQGRLRLSIFRGLNQLGRSMDLRAEEAGLLAGEHLLIQLYPLVDVAPCAAGLARVNTRSLDPMARHKTGNRLFYNQFRHWDLETLNPNIQWAHPIQPDEDEVVFVDEQDQLLEGTTSNLFLVHQDLASTPPRESGLLPGVLRGRLLAEPLFKAEVKVLTLKNLDEASEAFICNSMTGVRPLLRLGAKTFEESPGPVTRRAMAAAEEEMLKDLMPHLQ